MDGPAAPDERVRRVVAHRIRRAVRLLLAPFAALGALAAGLLFLILLPICGIGSIAEGLTRAAWGFAHTAVHPRGGVRGASRID